MLNSKERAYLKSLSVNADTLFQVGKGGISDALIKQVDDALTARELIKISALETIPEPAKDIAQKLADATNSEVVAVIGRKMIFWRRNKTNPKIVIKRKKGTKRD